MINNDFREPPRPHERRSPFATLDNPKRLRLVLYLGAAFSIVLFALGLTVPLTFSPTVCGFCHSMSPEINAWEKSSHAQVTCYGCHGDPSVVPLVKEHFGGGVVGFIAQINDDYEKPINAASELSGHMNPDTCLRCHSPETRSFTVTKGMAIDSKVHLKHLDAGVGCTVCHNRVAHKKIGDQYDQGGNKDHKYLDGMDMFEGCLRCHRAKKAFRSETGRTAPTKCETCHTDEWDLKPKSHADLTVWRDEGKHGQEARRNVSYCLNCHGGREENGIKECADCHGITMPHPSDWKEIHFNEAKKIGLDRCRRCHEGGSEEFDFCRRCHHGRFNVPGTWVSPELGVSRHPLAVRQNGATPCLSHHAPDFCTNCHLFGLRGREAYRDAYMSREPAEGNGPFW